FILILNKNSLIFRWLTYKNKIKLSAIRIKLTMINISHEIFKCKTILSIFRERFKTKTAS
ncbi:hypothetical protein, partial [Yersinia pestis]|uniref:hypothetical protein n=1 Tax=Yersinia pestis TaxID=632 RepID=UPI000267A242